MANPCRAARAVSMVAALGASVTCSGRTYESWFTRSSQGLRGFSYRLLRSHCEPSMSPSNLSRDLVAPLAAALRAWAEPHIETNIASRAAWGARTG